MSRDIEIEVWKWKPIKGPDQPCAACGDPTDEEVQFAEIGDHYPLGDSQPVCNQVECLDTLMQRCLDDLIYVSRNRKKLQGEERWNSREGK